MSYVLIAVIAWAMLGVVTLLEKFLLKADIKNPNVLGVYSGLFAVFATIVFLPFSKISSTEHFLFDLLCGAIFFFGILCFFRALKHGEVSEIVVLSGALTPLFSLGIVHFVLKIPLTTNEGWAFALLVLGILLISYRKVNSKKLIFWAACSAILLALYYSLVKTAYTPFVENFGFVRLGSFLASLLLLLSAATRKDALSILKTKKNEAPGLLITKEVLAGGSFIILNYAISIGNPALVNALEGTQYAFVFIVAAAISRFWPKVIKEDISFWAVFRKASAVVLIFIAILILQLK